MPYVNQVWGCQSAITLDSTSVIALLTFLNSAAPLYEYKETAGIVLTRVSQSAVCVCNCCSSYGQPQRETYHSSITTLCTRQIMASKFGAFGETD